MKGASIMDGVPRTLLARALYDNRPDCSDELAFCRGDILTILEQNVPESEGWWRCSLHGRRGLAPANRLQVLRETPADRPWPPSPVGLQEALAASPKGTCRAPTLLSPPPPSPVYEHMKSWVEGTASPTVQVYELPDPPAGARIVCETMLSFPKQAVFPIPRPAQASSPALYDVPVKICCPPAPKEPEKQQLYDIPASPRKAGLGPPACSPSRQSVPVTSTVAVRRACYKTLPNPQKSEWIYDTPASPKKAEARNASLTGFVDTAGPHAVLTPMTGFHCPLKSRARSLTPHLSENVPTQKKLSLPEIPAHCVPVPRDTTPSEEGGGYRVPSNFLIPRVEQQNTKPNIYDIPKTRPSAPPAAKELQKGHGASENAGDCSRAWAPQQTTWLCPELDRLSVTSADSRVSVVSSCSSTSTDSSSGSSSEESAKEPALDLDLAKGLVTALQNKVASSVTGLMLFVSRTWRLRGHLEANIGAIRRATGRVEESLREFLAFAHGVCGATGHLSDGNLQAKIRNQLQTICSSYQTLLETKESLDSCHWSLEVLVTDKAPNSPDDLERFVMVARMVPEDIKRFASMVIANGRLLFKQNDEKQDAVPLTLSAGPKLAKCVQFPQREVESYQRSAPIGTHRESGLSPELLEKNWANTRGKTLPNLEEEVKPILEQRSDENKGFETQNTSHPVPRPLGQQHPEKKVHLSEHCRLYFGALFKAIGVFHSSLSHGQSPEIFIAQSKLVIMIGQKLVDTLCRETQDRDARNEILCGSSHLCSLLKNVALATKHAVLQFPSPEALGHLQAEAQKLEQHTRQFRGALE